MEYNGNSNNKKARHGREKRWNRHADPFEHSTSKECRKLYGQYISKRYDSKNELFEEQADYNMIYYFTGDYAFLSNFYECPEKIVDDMGISYPTVEHYFQAQKSDDFVVRKSVSELETPGKAKRMGRKLPLSSDWEERSEKVMEMGLRLKFAHEDMKSRLLETGEKELVEGNNWGDTKWGAVDGIGRNLLGKLLMKLRLEYKNQSNI